MTDHEIKVRAMMDPGIAFELSAEDKQAHQLEAAINNSVTNIEKEDKEKVKEDSRIPGPFDWADTPSFADQYIRYPDLCRLVGPQMALFNVTEKDQLAELNKMLQKQQPEAAPSIVIANKKENFHEGKWLVLLDYYRVEYKTPISTS
jgi:hypothetical protein